MTINIPEWTGWLKIRNWEQWQTKRKNRDGTPYVQPWIKLYRRLMHDPNWVMLTDAQRGQLVCLWLLAADRDGLVPDDAAMLRKLCQLDNEPDVEVLVRHGFMERVDAALTPREHCVDAALKVGEKRREEERREKGARENVDISDSEIGDSFNELWSTNPRGPMVTAEREYWRAIDAGAEPVVIARRWQAYCARQAANEWTVGNLDRWLTKGGHMDASLDDVGSYGANGSPPLERLTAD